MLKILDKYILKKFLGTFFITISMFSLIAIVIDVSEKVEDFFRPDITLKDIIWDYYMGFVPWLYGLLAPILVFISVIFFTSKMAAQTEIIPVLSTGVNYRRFLRPYIIGAIFLTLLSLLMTHFIIPNASKGKLAFETKMNYSDYSDFSNIHKEIKPNEFLSIRTYSQKSDIAYNFNYDVIIKGHLVSRFSAASLKWEENSKSWVARNWHTRYITDSTEVLHQGLVMDTIFPFDNLEFHKKPSIIAVMNYFEINDYIEEEKRKGSRYIKIFELEQVKRTAIPCSILVLTIIGVAISSRKSKGGIGMHIAYGMGLASSYVFLGKVAEVFAVNTPLSAGVAVWLPNFIYLGIALFLYQKTPK